MKTRRTEAIVLNTFPVRERDKLVVFLTPDEGKVKGFAYGARSLKSRFGAALEPLAKVKIAFAEREGDEVVRIESVDLIRSLFPAQQNLVANVSASYIAETVDTFAQSGDPAELVYRLLDRTAEALLAGRPPLAVVAYTEIWMLRLGGVFPSLRHCIECHGPLERPLRFERVGFVCQQCRTRDAEVVPNEIAAALDDIMRLPVSEFAAPPDVLFELRSLAATMRRNFLGHELKSYEVLAGVITAR